MAQCWLSAGGESGFLSLFRVIRTDFSLGGEADGHTGYSHAATGVAQHSVILPGAVQ